jgi:GNAT superfamily N-acetyltransferase
MLIRWATKEDIPAWMKLADNVAMIFGNPTMSADKDFHEYMEGKLSKFEALIAVDRMSGECLGIIGFSRTYNRITWFGVFDQYRCKGIGTRLLSTALRQLDNTKDITVETYRDDYPAGIPARKVYHKAGFVDVDNTIFDHLGNPRCKMVIAPTDAKRGGSFHYNYPDYNKYSKEEFCLCCNNVPMPDYLTDIAELDYSFATAERIAQGKLFGKCHVLAKRHCVDFEENLNFSSLYCSAHSFNSCTIPRMRSLSDGL